MSFHWNVTRWMRFSLRGLLLLIVLVALTLGWFMERARRQGRAVEVLTNHGATVYYDWQLAEDGTPQPAAEVPGPAWVREWTGDDVFQTVVRVDFTFLDDTRDPNPVAALDSLHGIRQLRFLQGTVRDEDLVHVARQVQLEELELWNYGPYRTIEEMGLPQESLPEAPDRDFHHAVTAAGLTSLVQLPRLRRVTIYSTPVANEAIDHFSRMPALEELTLGYTMLKPSAIEQLRNERPDLQIDGFDYVP